MVAIHTVLQACAAESYYNQACELLRIARDGGFGIENLPDEKCFHFVLDSCQTPSQARDIIRQMQLSRRYRVGAVSPTMVSYTKAIKVCRKAKDVESARYFLKSATNNGIEPDVIMYSAAIWAAAGAGDSSAALEFLKSMESNGCQPNIVSYNGVIAAFASCGNAGAAVATYEEILSRGLRPTLTTYNYITASARKVKDMDERLQLLVRVCETIKPVDCTIDMGGPIFETLISTYGYLGL
jgi:pentatricopeptide repeat protein